jgi:hypothetical protein
MVSIETALAVIAAVWVGAFLVKSLLDLRRRGGETAEQAKTGLSISLYPLLLIVRTRSVAGPLDRLAQKAPRFWDAVSRGRRCNRLWINGIRDIRSLHKPGHLPL